MQSKVAATANELHITSQGVVGAGNAAIPVATTLVQNVGVMAVEVHRVAKVAAKKNVSIEP